MRESTETLDRDELIARDHRRLAEIVRVALERKPARIESVPAGLGNRRFHRLHFDDGREPRSMMARLEDDAPHGSPARPRPASTVPDAPVWKPEPALEPLRTFLEQAGLPVPRSYLHQPEAGLDLLEDVGDQTLGDSRGAARERLYREACQLIARLQRVRGDATRIPAFERELDRALLATKAWKWLHWTIPLLLERPATATETSETERLFERIGDLVLAAPRRLSHRDFKAENLHLRGSKGGSKGRSEDAASELVMIDLQGAFLAPPEYDLVCLLYDLQIDLEESFVRDCLSEIRPRLPDAPSPDRLQARFDALAVARLCKDVSHVVHAGRVRGDLRRWHEIPRGLELLERAASRLESSFPGIRTLTSVIQALTPRVDPADSAGRG